MGTRSTSTSTARTSSSRLSSPTTVPSSLPTTAVWSPRSSVVLVPVPGTRSPTDRCGLGGAGGEGSGGRLVAEQKRSGCWRIWERMHGSSGAWRRGYAICVYLRCLLIDKAVGDALG